MTWKKREKWVSLLSLVHRLPAPFPKSYNGIRTFIFQNDIETKVIPGKEKYGKRVWVNTESLNNFLLKEIGEKLKD